MVADPGAGDPGSAVTAHHCAPQSVAGAFHLSVILIRGSMRTSNLNLLFSAAILFVQQPGPATPLVRENATVKISEHVYVIPDGNVGGVPNVGIVVGSKATLIIESGLG